MRVTLLLALVCAATTARAQVPPPDEPYPAPAPPPAEPYPPPPAEPYPPPVAQPYQPAPPPMPVDPYGVIPPPVVAPVPYPYVQPQPPEPAKRSGVTFGLTFGGNYRYGLKENFGAAALKATIGGEGRTFGAGGLLGIDVGRSNAGLLFCTFRIGAELIFVVAERLRLGLAPNFGAFIIQRATNNDPGEDLSAFMIGIYGLAAVDLARGEHSALTLELRVGYDYIDVGSHDRSYGNSLSAALALGVRVF